MGRDSSHGPLASNRTKLDNYERFLLKTGPPVVVSKDQLNKGPGHSQTFKTSQDYAATKRAKSKTAGELYQSHESRNDATSALKPVRYVPMRHQNSTSSAGETSQALAYNDEVPFANDVHDAAGYSELQAAFERAYERMLKDPSASVVDTVLSSAWNPRSKKSALLRTSFQRQTALSKEWDTRSPAYEKKTFYDSILDKHCRRVVENPLFKETLLRTRPAADYMLANRIMDEETGKLASKKGSKKIKGGRRAKTERWPETVRRFVKGSHYVFQEERQAENKAEGARTRVAAKSAAEHGHEANELHGAGANRRSGEEGAEEGGEEPGRWQGAEEPGHAGGGHGGHGVGRGLGGDGLASGNLRDCAMDAVEELKKAWGVSGEDGVNANFNSLNSIIMHAGHRPEAFAALTEQLEALWTLLDAPEKEVVHVRRYCMSEGSATNVAHLFYQVSRWTQYKMQVQRTCSAIYEREMHLGDLRDHMLLAAGVPDEAVTGKLGKLFAMSHEAIQLVTAVKASFPGAGGKGCLLLDYIPKVRADIVELKQLAPPLPAHPPLTVEESEGWEVRGEGTTWERGDVVGGYTEHKVKLAARFVVEAVEREAEQYLKLLAHDPRRLRSKAETKRPP